MAEQRQDGQREYDANRKAYDACPHCGHELSPWQQVLLAVDRALVCKNCWYRIILDISENKGMALPPKDEE